MNEIIKTQIIKKITGKPELNGTTLKQPLTQTSVDDHLRKACDRLLGWRGNQHLLLNKLECSQGRIAPLRVRQCAIIIILICFRSIIRTLPVLEDFDTNTECADEERNTTLSKHFCPWHPFVCQAGIRIGALSCFWHCLLRRTRATRCRTILQMLRKKK